MRHASHLARGARSQSFFARPLISVPLLQRRTCERQMTEYAELRRRHWADTQQRIPAHLERLSWSADLIAAYQTRQLRELIDYAVQKSPWHRERLGRVDLK